MNNSFSVQQISKTGNLDPNLISRQKKLNLMAKFMQKKFENPKMKQSEIADQLGHSSSTLKRYRNDINMLSTYRIQPNITNKRTQETSNTNLDDNSHREHGLKRIQLTSNDLVKPDTNIESIIKRTSKKKNKNILKAGSVKENVEINDKISDEIPHTEKI